MKKGDIYASIDTGEIIELESIRKDMDLAWFFNDIAVIKYPDGTKKLTVPCVNRWPPCKTFYDLRVNWRKIGRL